MFFENSFRGSDEDLLLAVPDRQLNNRLANLGGIKTVRLESHG
jgi:hypothetical protein